MAWNSVKNGLPDSNGHYLVFRDMYDDEWQEVRLFNGTNFVELGHRLGSDEHQWIACHGVTHWMDLPESPK